MFLLPQDFLNRGLAVAGRTVGVTALEGGVDTVIGVRPSGRLGVDTEPETPEDTSVDESTEDERLLCGLRKNFFCRNDAEVGDFSGTGALTVAGVGVVGDSEGAAGCVIVFAVGGSAGISTGLGGVGG